MYHFQTHLNLFLKASNALDELRACVLQRARLFSFTHWSTLSVKLYTHLTLLYFSQNWYRRDESAQSLSHVSNGRENWTERQKHRLQCHQTCFVTFITHLRRAFFRLFQSRDGDAYFKCTNSVNVMKVWKSYQDTLLKKDTNKLRTINQTECWSERDRHPLVIRSLR